ncbi:type IV pilus twitching motility protein PilT [Candidatus Dojkabacteria bacterium]|uniref:Type IV pilus twitching motility protein PilT n=1 Tax=Candidatus Dojkabacteria bacterium TaxID=2099670 RepID=A0A955L3F6_9BACT|nr:type IV pilus twitching motility protein PilT [Candidatus Dojkabacteria bacterium]
MDSQTNDVPELKPEEAVDTSIKVKADGYKIEDLLDVVVGKDASDLHLAFGYPPMIRIDGKLLKIGTEVLNEKHLQKLIYSVLPDSKKELYEVNKEVDLSYAYKDEARFRVNVYHERGNMAAAFRLIPSKIRSVEDLQLPVMLHEFTKLPQGLILVTGPTGHGKSTSLAAMLQEINSKYSKHIITIEDPIEYIYPKGLSLVDQREMHEDTHDWSIALRSALRQDPDVVLVGEMRDFETIAATITIAETGHLVFATLHTNSAAQSIDRIIDVFPEHQQAQIRAQLANIIEGIVSQRLVPIIGGGRRAVCELLVATSAVRNTIREGKTFQIDNIIQTSSDVGMIPFDKSLAALVQEGKISLEDAQEYTLRPEELIKYVKR